MMKQWTSPVYAFYHPIPDIEYVDGWCMHTFKCAAKSCTYKCRRFLDGHDHSSTGNLSNLAVAMLLTKLQWTANMQMMLARASLSH
jgi:hypothetical protein